MKRISKQDDSRRADFVAKMRAAHEAVEEKVEAANEAIRAANAEIAALNEVYEEARGFAEDIGREIEEYMDERSDAWRDGDRFEPYDQWRAAWADWEREPFDDIAEIEPPESDAVDELDDLPVEPEV